MVQFKDSKINKSFIYLLLWQENCFKFVFIFIKSKIGQKEENSLRERDSGGYLRENTSIQQQSITSSMFSL